MASDSAEIAMKRLVLWAESLPKEMAEIKVKENPEINCGNDDYFVDYEVKFIPSNKHSLGITIWLSGSAIGIFIEDFAVVSEASGFKLGSSKVRFACSGTEPVSTIDIELVLAICNAVSKSDFNISAGAILGNLAGVYTQFPVLKRSNLKFSVGGARELNKIFVHVSYCRNYPCQD